jgi:hypothetical protein
VRLEEKLRDPRNQTSRDKELKIFSKSHWDSILHALGQYILGIEHST